MSTISTSLLVLIVLASPLYPAMLTQELQVIMPTGEPNSSDGLSVL